MRLLLVDDQAAYRESLAVRIERETDFRVPLRAGRLTEAIAAIEQTEEGIAVALVAQDLPDGDGIELRTHLQAFYPACHLVMLGVGPGRRAFARAAASGAAGIFARDAEFDAIVDGVRRLLAGEMLIPRAERLALLQSAARFLAEEQATRAALARLTPRESDILEALARGLSDKEMAGRLHLSTKTIATHMTSLLDKLNVESRLQAVLLALRFRIVSLELLGLDPEDS
jgi:DNA-binding NarL/FixJ family response regulator